LQEQQQKVLLIERKRKLESCFRDDLLRKGYPVLGVESGGEGLTRLNDFPPDVVIINAATLRTNGLRICSWYRNRLPDTPLILIVPEDEPIDDADHIDVILHLPFTVQKIVNRLRSFEITRNQDLLIKGPLQLNLKTRMVTYKEKTSYLTPRLARLLHILMQNPGVEFPRRELFKQAWKTDYTEDTRSLDVHISWLRKALEDDPQSPQLIKTVRGVGYKLDLSAR
jgi:DNA-binding response OmpR family regulator